MHADPVSGWFEAQGVSPLVGGALLGAALVYLLMRGRARQAQPFQVPRAQMQRPIAAVQGDVKEQALQLVRAKNKIEAIKLVRQHTGLGLKEAKDQVEAWAREAGAPR